MVHFRPIGTTTLMTKARTPKREPSTSDGHREVSLGDIDLDEVFQEDPMAGIELYGRSKF